MTRPITINDVTAKRNEMKDEFGDRVTIAVIPNSSHALFPEQPQLVSAALADWIGRLPAK